MKIQIVLLSLLCMLCQAAPLDIWCSIPPLTSIARGVGGDRVKVSCFMSGQQDPHTFSPSPKQVAGARQADLFLSVGMPFETAVQKKLSKLNPALQTLNLADPIETNGDMHVWLSLPLLTQMAEYLETSLTDLDPSGAATYRKNRQQYQQRLEQKHHEFQQRLAPLKGTVFYVYHPAFGHFAADYRLHQEAIELGGNKPTPKQLLSLIRRAREENVRTVFVQPQFDRRPAKIIADRIGGNVVSLNQLEEDPVETIQNAIEELEHAAHVP